MKVVVFGSRGMAGHMVVKYLAQQGHEITAIDRSHIDIEKTHHVDEFLDTLPAVDFVVNCVGLLVKDSIARPDRAALVNSWWPHRLEQHFAHSDTRIVHLSTDCVFDGALGPYTELAPHSESNAYGRSKSLGELNNVKDVTLRTSIIGPELRPGTGLMDWIRNNPESVLPGWDNAWWNGITTLELARCIDIYMHDPCISGVYHLVNNNITTNKFDLLCVINQVFDLNKTIQRTQAVKTVTKVLIDTRKEIDFDIPDYTTQLQRLRDFYPLAHVTPATS